MSARLLGRFAGLALVCLFAAAAPSARAANHFWQIKEVYTNSDGSVQFVEMFDSFSSENFVTGTTLTANSDGVIKTFTFPPPDLSGDTANRHMLIATSTFASLPGSVTPDYTFAAGGVVAPFFNPNATSITISYSASFDSITFTGASLPKNGTNSLTDTNLYSSQNLVSGVNSPTNYAGASGSIPEPVTAAALLAFPVASLLARRRRHSQTR